MNPMPSNKGVKLSVLRVTRHARSGVWWWGGLPLHRNEAVTGQKPPHDIGGGSRPDSPSTAICATVVGDREGRLGNAPLKLICEIGERRRWGSKMAPTKLTSALLAVGLLAGCANLQMMANAQRAETAKAEGKQLETECMAI